MTTLGKKKKPVKIAGTEKYKFFTLAELVPLLGLSHATLRMFIKTGRLPAVFLAGKWRVNQAALDAFLAGGDKAAAEPRAERKARQEARAALLDDAGVVDGPSVPQRKTPGPEEGAAPLLPVKEKGTE